MGSVLNVDIARYCIQCKKAREKNIRKLFLSAYTSYIFHPTQVKHIDARQCVLFVRFYLFVCGLLLFFYLSSCQCIVLYNWFSVNLSLALCLLENLQTCTGYGSLVVVLSLSIREVVSSSPARAAASILRRLK
jgi:hypothetical protein